MPRETIDSSAIAAVQYDEAGRNLDIDLTTGRLYRYVDVPPEVYEAFMAAKSKGRYYNDHIRDEFLCTRLR